MRAAAITSSPSTCPHSSKPLFEVSTVEARSCRALVNWKNNTAPRLVKILERPVGQQFAPFQRPFESAIAVGYVFQFSGRSHDGLEDHAELPLRIRG